MSLGIAALICPRVGWTEITALLLVAALGGAINAVAGGGTLLTFPTLLFFGTSPIVANATSTLALVVGTAGSIFGFRHYIPAVRPLLWRFAPISILGGFLGGVLLTNTSNRAFGKLVPFLILFATVLFLSHGIFRRLIHFEAAPVLESRRAFWGSIVFQFAVAVYGGFFGAGIGILMLASLGFIGLRDIHEMNTLKTILGSLINLVAALWFIWMKLIDLPRAAVMTVGAVAGYYIGAHFSQRIPQEWVRRLIGAIGFVLSAVTFYRQFVQHRA